MSGKRSVLRTSGIALSAVSSGFIAIDVAYRAVMGISFANRESCFVYGAFNRIAFIAFENTVELGLSVYVGCLLAALVERRLAGLGAILPQNPLVAFLYGSILPVCSCAAIPLAAATGRVVNTRTMISFLVAAPLLNPYIVFLSFTALGPYYGLSRIVCSGILSISAGYTLEFLSRRRAFASPGPFPRCEAGSCQRGGKDPFEETMRLFLLILPPLAIGAAISVTLELLLPDKSALIGGFLNGTLAGHLAVIAVGIPLYLCNGTDVFIIRPFIDGAGLATGTALEFSLASTALCVTSILILSRIIGKRLTAALVAHVTIAILFLGNAANYLGGILYGS